MGFTIETGISVFTVFIQGILSFFSPCVLPLVPLYLGYLSGGLGAESGISGGNAGKETQKSGGGRLFLRVLFFALGISAAFFILGLGASAAGTFFKEQRMLFARIGGVLVILFGLYQLGVFGRSRLLSEEHRIPFRLEKMTMSPLTALIMGFTFSFAWTPCVGPALASVLLMAGSAQTSAKGFLLIGIYTLGFILPFLAAGLFTAKMLEFFRKHRNAVRYTVKAGGVLMVFMGLLMVTGTMNNITGYLSSVQGGMVSDTDSGQDFYADAGGVYNSDPIVSGGSESASDGSVPRVIVTGFSTDPAEVKAGSDFKLTVHLKNTSKKIIWTPPSKNGDTSLVPITTGLISPPEISTNK